MQWYNLRSKRDWVVAYFSFLHCVGLGARPITSTELPWTRLERDTSMQSKTRMLLLALALAVGVCLLLWNGYERSDGAAPSPASAAGLGQPNLTAGDPCRVAACLQGTLTPSASVARPVVAVPINEQVYVVDLARMGVHPLAKPLSPTTGEPGKPANAGANPLHVLDLLLPDSGAVGVLGAYMSVSPDVISQSIASGFGAVSANWTPGESVAVSLNGGAPTNYIASATGRLGQIFNVGAGEGYITIEARGLTSGRQTGGVVEVRDSGPVIPGLAIAPHAINPDGSSNINVLGTRYYANGSVTLARDGAAINTLSSGATGSFYYQINVAPGADTSAIYSTYTTTVGSQVGQSIEERADAGVPPYGDQNVTRAFVDRPAVASAGGTVAVVGEGFQPGEAVNVTSCGSLGLTADANGAVRFFNGVSGSGTFHCVLTGGISGRVARAAGLVASNVINAPAIIAAPAAVEGTGTFTLILDRLLPSQSGSVYIDGVLQGSFSTDSSGKAAALINKPSTGFLHAVRWVGVSGQSVVAPLLYLPGGGSPTPTRTRTFPPTATRTPTITPTRTITPVVAAIVGHVVWQGLPAQPNQLQQMPITLILKSGTTEVNFARQLTDSSGFFTVSTTLPPGTYNWRAKGNTYLATGGTVVLTGAPVIQVDMGLQTTSDLNGDNVITVLDFNFVKSSFGTGGVPPLKPAPLIVLRR